MKRNLLKVGLATIAVALVVAVLTFSTSLSGQSPQDVLSSVRAPEINPDCPNGCVNGGGGCYCYGDYPQYKEFNWGD